MSSVFKGIKKVFKKVIKTIKKIAPIILMAAAIYFTAGAALAAVPAAAGATVATTAAATTAAGSAGIFGGISSAIVSGLGVTSPVIAGVINGAVTYGITGAAMGGVTAAITGGDIGKGILYGGLTGAIGGGISGGFAGQAAAAAAAPQIGTGLQYSSLAGGTPTPGFSPGAGSGSGLGSGAGAGQVRQATLPSTDAFQKSSFEPGAVYNEDGSIYSRAGAPAGSATVTGAQNTPTAAGVADKVALAPAEKGVISNFMDEFKITGGDLLQAGVKGVSAAFGEGEGSGRADAANINAQSAIDQQNNEARLIAANYSGGSSLGLPRTVNSQVKGFSGGNIQRNPETGLYQFRNRVYS